MKEKNLKNELKFGCCCAIPFIIIILLLADLERENMYELKITQLITDTIE
jgi:hypothetical protein